MSNTRIALLLITAALILSCGAMALPQNWMLVGSSHTGTVTLNGDGTGSATISGYPFTIDFSYQMNADGTGGTAYYMWIESVPFTVNPDRSITSPNYPGPELVPVN